MAKTSSMYVAERYFEVLDGNRNVIVVFVNTLSGKEIYLDS